jgi:glutathione S-transferase
LGTKIVKVSSSSAHTRIKLGDSMKPESIIELIGMMDSPFVRRVAIALDAYGISYTHTPLSVYRNPELLAAINPLMTVPVLRYGGKQLIDSARILEWIHAQVDEPWLPPSGALRQAAAVSDIVSLKMGEYYRQVGLLEPANRNSLAVQRLTNQINAGLCLLDSDAAIIENENETMLNDAAVAIATGYAFTREIAFALKIGLVSTSRLDQWCAGFERSLGENHIR